MHAFLKLLPYLKPHWRWMTVSMVTAPILAALRASPVLLIKEFIEHLDHAQTKQHLLQFSGIILAVFVANFIVRFLHFYSNRRVMAKVNQQLKNNLYDHVMGLSAGYFSDQRIGALMSRIGSDTDRIDQGIAQFNVIAREPIQLAYFLGYCFYVEWKLTLLSLIIIPPMAFVFAFSAKAVKRYVGRITTEQASLYATMQESFSGTRTIQAFRLENYLRSKFRGQSHVFTLNQLKTAALEEAAHPAIEIIIAVAIAFLIYYGGSLFLAGELTKGQLLSFFVSFGLMGNPIRSMGETNVKLSSAAAAADRIDEVFRWKSTITDPTSPKPLAHFKNAIEFKDVSFAYPDNLERSVLKEVSFQIPKGARVAFVGPSGAGKSSLAALIPRIYDVTSGSITIDGIDVREMTLKNLRESIGIVSQDVFLFNDTIIENIRCGNLQASDEQIFEAAKRAHAVNFISKLPQGFQTVIGDRGQKLSGGERQRISIARAFLRDAPILILDEATSALDNESEKAVQTALDELMKDKTTLVIAHRLSTIQSSDVIYAIHEGRILEKGSHYELISHDGLYARLLRASQL